MMLHLRYRLKYAFDSQRTNKKNIGFIVFNTFYTEIYLKYFKQRIEQHENVSDSVR